MTRPPGFEHRFRAALAFLNNGDLLAAGDACVALGRLAPNDPAVLQLHATVALRAGRPEDAQAAVGECLRLQPDHVPALLLGARAALALDAPARAIALLRRALSRGTVVEATFLLCHALLAAGGGGLGAAMEAAAACPGAHAQEWHQLGKALQRAGQSSAALAAFSHAIAADAGLAAAYLGRGLLLRDAGRLSEAREALHRATSLDPDAAGAWFALGLTHQDLGQDAAAAGAYEAALAARPAFAEAAVNLGVARQALGDMAAAMQAYRRAVAIRPDTLGRIAQALTAATTGTLWLDPAALRRALCA